jgi:hypothetical protein
MEHTMPFNVRTATAAELIERADYLENFPAGGRYRDYLHAEASALRRMAEGRT